MGKGETECIAIIHYTSEAVGEWGTTYETRDRMKVSANIM